MCAHACARFGLPASKSKDAGPVCARACARFGDSRYLPQGRHGSHRHTQLPDLAGVCVYMWVIGECVRARIGASKETWLPQRVSGLRLCLRASALYAYLGIYECQPHSPTLPPPLHRNCPSPFHQVAFSFSRESPGNKGGGGGGGGGGLFKANAVNEEDFERDRATLV